jgi:hypothetical protein
MKIVRGCCIVTYPGRNFVTPKVVADGGLARAANTSIMSALGPKADTCRSKAL